ncbi:MAG: hypothetical protein A2W05_05155 [Candidatus Schekmanbacteria bacterium RBG_16_38_10]|uniref:histidine kinase n=1 Tax=Candidatus Schekmanbacteria bacterium RBG_16_38_10 TaxID=1817879 RepID=A0A1F7RUT0_9BACT|nr:MAG: hypothetical protein A2W05_05155 [Candidatus Schekmanbacteria bacterium RBG_16_38_10]
MKKNLNSGAGKTLKEIIHALPDGMMVVDRDFCIDVFNTAMEELSGISFNRVYGKSVFEVFPENNNLIELVKKTLSSETTFSDYQTDYIKKDRQKIPVSITTSPLISSKGKTEGSIIIVKDLTTIKRLEERASNLEKMQISGVLAAGIVHEIRNPLGGIKGAAQLLLEEIKDNAEHKEYTNIIIQEVERLSRLTDSLMELTKRKKLFFEQCNIHSILDQVIFLEKARIDNDKIRFSRTYDPSLPDILASKDSLFQVFHNIIKNSLEELGEKGDIDIRTKFSREYHPVSKDTASKQYIVVEIQDSGRGISEEIRKNLFTPFCTSKPQGVGLGLALSFKIIEEHNGFIRVESEEGKGAVFKIYLPLP